jgi:hypothetical protein
MSLFEEAKALTVKGKVTRQQRETEKANAVHNERLAAARASYDTALRWLPSLIKEEASGGGSSYSYLFTTTYPTDEDFTVAWQLAKVFQEQGFTVSVLEKENPNSERGTTNLEVTLSW